MTQSLLAFNRVGVEASLFQRSCCSLLRSSHFHAALLSPHLFTCISSAMIGLLRQLQLPCLSAQHRDLSSLTFVFPCYQTLDDPEASPFLAARADQSWRDRNWLVFVYPSGYCNKGKVVEEWGSARVMV